MLLRLIAHMRIWIEVIYFRAAVLAQIEDLGFLARNAVSLIPKWLVHWTIGYVFLCGAREVRQPDLISRKISVAPPPRLEVGLKSGADKIHQTSGSPSSVSPRRLFFAAIRVQSCFYRIHVVLLARDQPI